jgi:FixJ family two-component response regulator
MISERLMVFVVDDDDSLRKALVRMLEAKGYRVSAFSSAEAFLKQHLVHQIACLVLDLQLPGLSGLELQNSLLQQNIFLPIIFITGHGSIPTAVRAVKAGATGFLTKPFTDDQLLAEIESALALCRVEFAKRSEIENLRQRFGTLTRRESEIFFSVVSGKLNKQTASDLGIDINTVKVHRRRVMLKMHAESLADLVVMAQKLQQVAGVGQTFLTTHAPQ